MWFTVIREWLKHRMEEAAKHLPEAATFGSAKERRLALLRLVYTREPAHHIARRNFLRKAIELIEDDKQHDTHALEALTVLARHAEQE